ncbi:hypothetical protein Efla_004578 [Eimeria flavescens]
MKLTWFTGSNFEAAAARWQALPKCRWTEVRRVHCDQSALEILGSSLAHLEVEGEKLSDNEPLRDHVLHSRELQYQPPSISPVPFWATRIARSHSTKVPTNVITLATQAEDRLPKNFLQEALGQPSHRRLLAQQFKPVHQKMCKRGRPVSTAYLTAHPTRHTFLPDSLAASVDNMTIAITSVPSTRRYVPTASGPGMYIPNAWRKGTP